MYSALGQVCLTKNTLIILLVIIGIAMMYLRGLKAPKFMMPPFLSGVAFLLIAGLFKMKE